MSEQEKNDATFIIRLPLWLKQDFAAAVSTFEDTKTQSDLIRDFMRSYVDDCDVKRLRAYERQKLASKPVSTLMQKKRAKKIKKKISRGF